jgi:hypothetical protein
MMGQTLVRRSGSWMRSRWLAVGPRRLTGRGTVTTLSAALTDQNSFAQPTKVAPTTTRVSGLGNRFVYDFPANSVTFIRLTRR